MPITNTKPDLRFNKEGICTACQRFDKREYVGQKVYTAEKYNKWDKSENKSEWDCVIPVSSGKDSTVQALIARDLGLNCLLVLRQPVI